jgi:hypothetical protein
VRNASREASCGALPASIVLVVFNEFGQPTAIPLSR